MPLSAQAQRARREKLKKLGLDPNNITRELPKKKLPRRRCRNCNAQFLKTRANKVYCSKKCADEYNKMGSAYGPLRMKLEKLMEEKSYEHAKARLKDFLLSPYFPLILIAAGFDQNAKEGSAQLLMETWEEYARPAKRSRRRRA